MKRLFSLLIAVVIVFCLCACGSQKNDEGFIKNVQNGLETRWKTINASASKQLSTNEVKEYYANLANVELKAIGNLSEYTFEDKQLSELASQYVEALNNQVEGASYYGMDDKRYNDLYTNKGYYIRGVIINKLVDEYGLHVSNSFSDSLNELIYAGKLYSALASIPSSELTLESLGSPNYELLIENTSEYDFSNASLLLKLYDEDGVVVDTVTSYLQNWAAGSKNRASIYSNKQFSSVEMALSYYASTGEILTDYIPIEFVNNMVIDISIKNTMPAQFLHYSSTGNLYTSCIVDDFSFEGGYWNNGKTNVTLMISGRKTYDVEGDYYSRACNIGWKLYDQANNVVDSGTFYTSKIRVGEVFSNCSSYANNLRPGSYQLVLLDVK